jgi:hypothetical protein
MPSALLMWGRSRGWTVGAGSWNHTCNLNDKLQHVHVSADTVRRRETLHVFRLANRSPTRLTMELAALMTRSNRERGKKATDCLCQGIVPARCDSEYLVNSSGYIPCFGNRNLSCDRKGSEMRFDEE